MITITPNLAVPHHLIEERFVRASGPGGQNVNKVSTAVELRIDIAHWDDLPEGARARLVKLSGQRLTLEGVVVIQADRFRTQPLNRADAEARFVELVKKALVAPKRRVATKPGKAAKERRLTNKGVRADVKRARQRPVGE